MGKAWKWVYFIWYIQLTVIHVTIWVFSRYFRAFCGIFNLSSAYSFTGVTGGGGGGGGGHCGAVITLASHLWDQSVNPGLTSRGKAWHCSAVYSAEPWPTVCTGFLCPSNYPSWYELYSVESDIKPQINKQLLTKENRLLSETTTYIFNQRNRWERDKIEEVKNFMKICLLLLE